MKKFKKKTKNKKQKLKNKKRIIYKTIIKNKKNICKNIKLLQNKDQLKINKQIKILFFIQDHYKSKKQSLINNNSYWEMIKLKIKNNKLKIIYNRSFLNLEIKKTNN